MDANSSVVIPCCSQQLHVTCLSRCFSSRGLVCPFCNQSLATFASSSTFQAASVLHECVIDVNATPTNQGVNSLVLPQIFPPSPDHTTFLCCPRRGPPPLFEPTNDRRMEWSPHQNPGSSQWISQWLCVQCNCVVGPLIPHRPEVACSSCGSSCSTLVVDCVSSNRWMWCGSCQRREEIRPIASPDAIGAFNWFVRGPLSTMGSLYGWGESPISPPGSGPQSWLFCPLISLGLVAAEQARGAPLYSTGSRSPVPDVQRAFWCSQAMEVIQLYSDFFQSLSPQSDVALSLQCGWSGGQHLPADVQERCTPPQIMAALYLWLSSQCSAFSPAEHPAGRVESTPLPNATPEGVLPSPFRSVPHLVPSPFSSVPVVSPPAAPSLPSRPCSSLGVQPVRQSARC